MKNFAFFENFVKCRFGSNFEKKSILVKCSKNVDFGQIFWKNFDFGENLRKI